MGAGGAGSGDAYFDLCFMLYAIFDEERQRKPCYSESIHVAGAAFAGVAPERKCLKRERREILTTRRSPGPACCSHRSCKENRRLGSAGQPRRSCSAIHSVPARTECCAGERNHGESCAGALRVNQIALNDLSRSESLRLLPALFSALRAFTIQARTAARRSLFAEPVPFALSSFGGGATDSRIFSSVFRTM